MEEGRERERERNKEKRVEVWVGGIRCPRKGGMLQSKAKKWGRTAMKRVKNTNEDTKYAWGSRDSVICVCVYY